MRENGEDTLKTDRQHPCKQLLKRQKRKQVGRINVTGACCLNFMHFGLACNTRKTKSAECLPVVISLPPSLLFPFTENSKSIFAFLPQRSLDIRVWFAVSAARGQVTAPEGHLLPELTF